MGWNASGFIVAGEFDPGALPDIRRRTGERAEFPTGSSAVAGLGVARLGGWTVVADPDLDVVFDDAALEAIPAPRVLTFFAHSVSDTYGFAWFADGRLRRRLITAESDVVEEAGEALPEESHRGEFVDEDFVFDLIERLTGLGWDAVAEAEYEIWAARPGEGA